MDHYRVVVSKAAENDMFDIVHYIASQFSAPITALNMMDLLEEAITSLSRTPQRIPLVRDDEFAQMGYRHLGVKNYFVFFSIDEKNKVVFVERILYARRDWTRIL